MKKTTRSALVREPLPREATHDRFLFERNPLPMWIIDRETLRFLAVNDAAVQHYGYSREEFLAKTASEVRPRSERARLRAAVAAAPDGYYEGGTWTHRRKDGSEISVEILSHTLTFEGRPARIAVCVDVTERLRIQERLRRSTEALRALSARLATIRNRQTRRAAREIHDEVRQALTSLKIELGEFPHGLGDSGSRGGIHGTAEEPKGSRLHERLSDRELEVFRLFARGKTLTAIARQLSLSVQTVSTYRARISDKTGLQSREEMIRYAIGNQLLD
jgi:PAS domain S-box-containing protein